MKSYFIFKALISINYFLDKAILNLKIQIVKKLIVIYIFNEY